MLAINKAFIPLATFCTNRENHKTQESYDNSLIIKRFMFEFLVCYTHLLYVAFWKLDIMALRKELGVLFMADEFRRLASETLLPYTMNYIKNKNNDEKEQKEDILKEELDEV